jgi:hypothetical protein
MNSHERRIVERRWRHAININNDNELLDECLQWLSENLGSCGFTRRNNPRWCWRPNYNTNQFAQYCIGAQIFFRYDRDYAWFLLKWE